MTGVNVILFASIFHLLFNLYLQYAQRNSNDEFINFKFEIEPEDIMTSESYSAFFNCKFNIGAQLFPKYYHTRIEWLKDGTLLFQNEDIKRRIELLNNGTLIIRNTTSVDDGFYQCSIYVYKENESPWIFLSRRAKIIWDEIDHFEYQPTDTKVNLGEFAAFRCMVSSRISRKMSMMWYHNEKLMGQDQLENNVVPISNTLVIPNVGNESSGAYRCNVHDGIRSTTSHSGFLLISEDAPLMALKPLNQSIIEGQIFVLECLPANTNKSTVQWIKNKRLLGSDHDRIFLAQAYLLITNASREDAGTYICRVETDNNIIEFAAAITVNVPPKITTLPENTVVQETMDAEFECFSEGQPKPRIRWYKNGEIITPNEYFLIAPDKLIISGVVREDEGVYQCFADNELGSDQASAQLRVEKMVVLSPTPLPLVSSRQTHTFTKDNSKNGPFPFFGTVQNFRPKVLGPEAILVEWDAPESIPDHVNDDKIPLRYRLLYTKANQTINTAENKETQILMVKNSFTLHGLQKYTPYLIRVEYENENGLGPSTPPFLIRTLSDVPSAPPQEIEFAYVSSTSFSLKWVPPPGETHNGQLVGYKIRYKSKLKDDKQGNSAHIIVNETAVEKLTHLFENLRPDTQYSIKICAINTNGSGPYSPWKIVQTLAELKDETQIAGAPSQLKVYPSYNSITIRWGSPTDTSILIRGYIIGWGINIPDIDKATVDSEQREFLIRELKPNREYVVSLRAYNSIGYGFPIYETVRTLLMNTNDEDEDIESERQNLSHSQLSTPIAVLAETISSSSIRLSWIDPNNDAFNQHYSVRYSESDVTVQPNELTTSETEYLFEGLKPNTQYEFTVKLAESIQWSMAALNKTFSAPPSSPPRDLAGILDDTRANGVSLNWHEPKYANGQIEEYIVLYTNHPENSDNFWIMDSTKGNQNSIDVQNLSKGSTYYFKVQARNSKGYGPFSSIISLSLPKPLEDTDRKNNDESNPNDGSLLQFKFEQFLSSHAIYIVISVISIILLLITALITITCAKRTAHSVQKNTKNRHKREQQYIRGKKLSRHDEDIRGDLWLPSETIASRFTTTENYLSAIANNDNNHGGNIMAQYVGNKSPFTTKYVTETELINNESSTNIHSSQQFQLLRTPQTAYPQVQANRQLGVKFDSAFGGSELNLLPVGDHGVYHQSQEDYIKTAPALEGFCNQRCADGNVTPHVEGTRNQRKTAQIVNVKPIVFANSSENSPYVLRNENISAGVQKSRDAYVNKPATFGQKSTLVPVGRATAHRVVNVALPSNESSASPYSFIPSHSAVDAHSKSINSRLAASIGAGSEPSIDSEISQHQHIFHTKVGSHEAINVNEIDDMIDTLQQLQNEFKVQH